MSVYYYRPSPSEKKKENANNRYSGVNAYVIIMSVWWLKEDLIAVDDWYKSQEYTFKNKKYSSGHEDQGQNTR